MTASPSAAVFALPFVLCAVPIGSAAAQNAAPEAIRVTVGSDGSDGSAAAPTILSGSRGGMIFRAAEGGEGVVIMESFDGPLSFYNTTSFAMPGTTDVQELLRPEFLRRDARLLAEALELHRDQGSILRLLLDTYGEEFDEASAELRAALERFRRNRMIEMTGGMVLPDAVAPEGFASLTIAPTGDQAIEVRMGTQYADLSAAAPNQVRVAVASAGSNGDGSGTSSAVIAERVTVNWSNAAVEIDEAELEALNKRIADRMAAVRARIEEARRKLEEEQGPVPTARQIYDLARTFRAQRDALAEQLHGDILLILSDAQRDLMETAMRLQRIDMHLPNGRFGAESLDLRALLAGMPPASVRPEELESMVMPWAAELSELLRDRVNRQIDFELAELKNAADVEDGQESQPRRILNLARHVAETRQRICELTEEALQSVARMLDSKESHDLVLEARRRGFPSIYLPSQVLRSIGEAIAYEGLDENLIEALREMRSEYETRLMEFNERIVRANRESEIPRALMRLEIRAAQATSEDIQSDIARIVGAVEGGAGEVTALRSEYAMQTLRRLRDLIGSEIYGALPSAMPMR